MQKTMPNLNRRGSPKKAREGGASRPKFSEFEDLGRILLEDLGGFSAGKRISLTTSAVLNLGRLLFTPDFKQKLRNGEESAEIVATREKLETVV